MGVKLVGLEFEGGWRNRIFLDAAFRDDISVPCPEVSEGGVALYAHKPGRQPWHFGEIVSPPLAIGEVFAWADKHYPIDPSPVLNEGTGQERGSGIHVHLSFDTLEDYSRVASRRFYNVFLTTLAEWGRRVELPETSQFWRRLKGANRFAKRHFNPRRQIGVTTKNSQANAPRRTALNYCFGLHGTVEVRIAPTFMPKAIGLDFIRVVVDCFEDFLSSPKGIEMTPFKRVFLVGDVGKVLK